jgi:hypothetical protein
MALSETAYVYAASALGQTWDSNTPLVVSATAGTLDTTWYDGGIDWFLGRVKLTATGATVTVSGARATSVMAVANIHQWLIDVANKSEDTTPLGVGWGDLTAVGKTSRVTLGRWRDSDQNRFDLLGSDVWVVLKLDENASTGWWVMARRSQLGYTKTVGAADREAVAFEVATAIARY